MIIYIYYLFIKTIIIHILKKINFTKSLNHKYKKTDFYDKVQ
jgi:hypothetical protein